jgi:hypothetical protein
MMGQIEFPEVLISSVASTDYKTGTIFQFIQTREKEFFVDIHFRLQDHPVCI